MNQQAELGRSQILGTLLSNLLAHCDGDGLGPGWPDKSCAILCNSGDILSWLCSSGFEPVHDGDLAAKKNEVFVGC